MVISDSCVHAEPRAASALRNQVCATDRRVDASLAILEASLRLHGPTNAGEPGASAHTATVSFVVRGEAPLHSGISVGGRHVHQDPVRQPLAGASSADQAARAGTPCAVDPPLLFGPQRGVACDASEEAELVILRYLRRRAASMAVRSDRSSAASRRAVQGRRSVTTGGALRSNTRAVPNGRVRIASGGMTGTRRMERWSEREPWSPTEMLSVRSSRSPMSAERSCRSRAADVPPSTTLTMDASQIAPAAWSPHLSLACDRDCKTGIVVMPVPPPSAIRTGMDGRGERLPISSRAMSSGGSSRAPGEAAARWRAVSTRSSMNAATNDQDAPAPAPVASRYSVPLLVRKLAGSNSSPGPGETASRTRGSARHDSASETPIQMESLVRGSEWIIDSSESAQPDAA